MRLRDRDLLGWLAMGAAVAVAAHGEWSLAVAAGFGTWVAAALPVAIDAYAIRAMQRGREVAVAVGLMIATNAAAHLHAGGRLEMSPWLVVAVSAIAPVVLWRVHALRHGTAQAAPAPQGGTERDTPAQHPVPGGVSPARTEARPAPASPQVICGGHLPVPTVPPRPRIESAAEARAVIEAAWRDGLSVREAARRATRSPAQVQRVYSRLDAERGAPIEGQTEIPMGDAA